MNTDSEDSEDEEDCEITDSEEQKPVQANTSALEILIASSQKHGSFDSTLALPINEDRSLLKERCLEDLSRSESGESSRKYPHIAYLLSNNFWPTCRNACFFHSLYQQA